MRRRAVLRAVIARWNNPEIVEGARLIWSFGGELAPVPSHIQTTQIQMLGCMHLRRADSAAQKRAKRRECHECEERYAG